MKALLPPPLVRGDRIGIVAPAGPLRPEALDRGMAYLEARGYTLVPGEHLRDRHSYLAGSDVDRLSDLNRMLADPSIRAVWFARGGYGSSRIVAGVDFLPLRRDPKALIGYSDLTVLQAAAYRKVGLASYHGPMVNDLGDPASFDEPSLWRAVAGGRPGYDFVLDQGQVLRHGIAEGPLVGGCLSVLVGLVGTPYEPPADGAILFWEDVGEEPYRLDRMLGHLRLTGRLEKLRGMVVGRLVGCAAKDRDNEMPIEEILRTHLRRTDYPVILDFPAGHCPGKVTLPLGRRARLDTGAGRLAILEE